MCIHLPLPSKPAAPEMSSSIYTVNERRPGFANGSKSITRLKFGMFLRLVLSTKCVSWPHGPHGFGNFEVGTDLRVCRDFCSFSIFISKLLSFFAVAIRVDEDAWNVCRQPSLVNEDTIRPRTTLSSSATVHAFCLSCSHILHHP